MSFKHFITLTIPFCFSALLSGQNIYPVSSAFNSIRQNGVSAIEASGDTLWISPVLNYNIANSTDWFFPENILDVLADEGRVFSIAVDGPRIIAGLGSSPVINGESVVTGFGYYVSSDQGAGWTFHEFPVDEPPPSNCNDSVIPYDGSCDISFTYGGEQYFRIRNNVAQQSPPYSVSLANNVIFSANWASGLLRSPDFGTTWERLILPPTSADSLTPDSSYIWASSYNGETVNRYDARYDLNLLGFSTMVDQDGHVWFGSANGINISPNAVSAPSDSIKWTHIQYENSIDGLLSNWVVDIEEDTSTGTVWMTNWVVNPSQGERYGVVSTNDRGISFQQYLIGERINDIAFKEGAIFAVGDTGIFISRDNGQNWSYISQVNSANTFIKSDARYFAVESTNNRVWIGTSDGLASTADFGATWEITRVNYPLSGGNVFEPVTPSVDTYAYPNPFSPTLHEIARIKFEVKEPGIVKICVFDFRMNLVKELLNQELAPDTYEITWDGVNESGGLVANAPYIYLIEMSDRTIHGKIVVVE